MIYESIYKDIVSSFNELWKVKERGKSLEIITPFATTSQRFVSLFLTEKDNEYIVTDGGWISEGLYDNVFDREQNCFEKIFQYYINSFNIKVATKQNGTVVFFKKTDKAIIVPSLLFDMANFVSSIVSLTNVEYSDKEKETEHTFRRTARNYLERIRLKKTWKEWHFDDYLDNKKEVKPSAILRKKNNKVVLLNFITGSDYHYFRSNISKANIVFELAENSRERVFIENKIALIDNKAGGYKLNKVSIWLHHLITNTHAKKVEWTKRRELEKI